MVKNKLPLGFKANGLYCGIKRSGKPDLGLIHSDSPAKACGLFTTNRITSGSVKLCQKNLNKSRSFRAIIVNSGNANCFVGQSSLHKAKEVTGELARQLGIMKQEALMASTGIIGHSLPVNRIKKAMPLLIKGLRQDGLSSVAKSITTTDTFTKISSKRINIGRRAVRICGLAKGAGMIAPDLALGKATMLCFILSDANITQGALRKSLREAVHASFNCITVDGCMSTNDTVLMMANACADTPEIKQDSSNFNKFSSVLKQVCLDLAKMIIKDAEGASKFIQIKVSQARNQQEAKRAALSIANSNLFKTAMFGQSNNLGRVIAALGASGIDVKEENIRIRLSPLSRGNIDVDVSLKRGRKSATVYTSDLTTEYVKINADYS